MSQHPEGWRLGAQVYAVFDRGIAKPRYMSITKIGRRWITIKDGGHTERFDAETMHIDGGQYISPGRVYLHEDDYRNTLEINKAWADFARRLSHTPPDHITMTDISTMKTMLWPEEKT